MFCDVTLSVQYNSTIMITILIALFPLSTVKEMSLQWSQTPFVANIFLLCLRSPSLSLHRNWIVFVYVFFFFVFAPGNKRRFGLVFVWQKFHFSHFCLFSKKKRMWHEQCNACIGKKFLFPLLVVTVIWKEIKKCGFWGSKRNMSLE